MAHGLCTTSHIMAAGKTNSFPCMVHVIVKKTERKQHIAVVLTGPVI
jgi:hypothetical protein